MDWKAYLTTEINETYHAAESLIKMIEPDTLDWKPSTENNWMTVGQLLEHMSCATGMPIKGFATGDWGASGDQPPEADVAPENMLPPAEALPTCSSTEAALAALAKDKELAFATIEALSNEDIATKTASAPWDPRDLPLGFRFAQMVDHLKQHRAQLFYYLKLQGKPVNTWDFYGMEMPGA